MFSSQKCPLSAKARAPLKASGRFKLSFTKTDKSLPRGHDDLAPGAKASGARP